MLFSLEAERGIEHALEMRVAHADAVHVLERVADVIHASSALAYPLGDEACASVQIELSHVRRVAPIRHEGERVRPPAAG